MARVRKSKKNQKAKASPVQPTGEASPPPTKPVPRRRFRQLVRGESYGIIRAGYGYGGKGIIRKSKS